MRFTWVVLSLCCLSSPAQDDGPRNTAHVRTHPELDQVVTRASALARDGRWAQALEIYQDAVAKYPNTVIPLDKGRACGLWEYVLAQIGAWPEEGRAVYRSRVDPSAELLFAGAKRGQDVDALERLIETCPFSSYVDDALALIANLRLDAGDDERAAAALTRLLDLEGDAARPETLARLGSAASRLGRKALVEELAARARPDAKFSVGGRDVPLTDHLKALAAATREGGPAAPPIPIPAWEFMGGGPTGSKLAEPGVELAGLAWRARIGAPRYEVEDTSSFYGRGNSLLHGLSEFRPLFPAVSDGILYVHNGSALFALNFFARKPDLLWRFRPPEAPGEVMFDDRVICPVTVHDGRVYANLIASVGAAEDQMNYVRVKYPFPRRALFALDAYSGRMLWRVGGRVQSERLEENATFSAPPVPEDGRLYAAAVRQVYPTDPFEHYVLCLDAATGLILWSTFVASGGTEINLFGNSTRESLGTPVAVTADSVFYATNHGVVAALEKKTGRLRWTYRYRQLPINPTRRVDVIKNAPGWLNGPPVAAQGIVAVAPTDGLDLLGLDARTGELRWERLRTRELRSLYGARDATLVVGGERLEFVDIRTGDTLVPAAPANLGGSGRGVLAEDGIYVPCRDKLRRVRWDGTWDEARAKPWDNEGGAGGNVLVVDGAIVLATQDAVEVYFDRQDLEKTILQELKRDPDNPAVLYRGALRFLQSGEVDEAARHLALAVERSAGSARPEDERLHRAARRRLYAVSMEAGRAALVAGRHDRAAVHFTAARAAAPDAASRVEASLRVAEVHLAKGDPAGAVEEFQRLLAGQGDARVFDLARGTVEAILKTAGREVYAKHEAEARRLLEEARRAGTADAFVRIFQGWPNSLAADDALFEAAAASARVGRAEDEIAAFRRYLREFPAGRRAPDAHAALVRALEAKGHLAGAGAILRQLARLFPDAEVADGDARVKARDFAERRLRSEAYARPAAAAVRAELAPPLRKALDYREEKHGRGAPLTVEGLPPAAAAELVFMSYGATVKALDLARSTAAWSLSRPSPARFATFFEGSLLLAGDSSVERVNPRDGSVEWRYETPFPMSGFAATRAFLCFFTRDPQGGSAISALDTGAGTIAWSRSFEGEALSAVHAAGDAVVFVATAPARILACEVETGKRLGETALVKDLPGRVVHASESTVLVQIEGRLLAEGRFLEAYALPGLGLKWRMDLKGFWPRADVQVSAAGVVLLGTVLSPEADREERFMAVADLQGGKLLRMTRGMDLGDPRFMTLEGESAVVFSREPDQSVAVRAVRLADLSIAWKADLGLGGATLLQRAPAGGPVVAAAYERGPDGRFGYSGILLDKEGRIAQNISSGFLFEQPPDYAVSNGRLIFSVDNKVEVYR